MLLAQRVGISHPSTRYKFILLKLIPVPMSDIANVSRPRNVGYARQRNGSEPRRDGKVLFLARNVRYVTHQ